jgi:Spy/CpxP family protein refolding chaperone
MRRSIRLTWLLLLLCLFSASSKAQVAAVTFTVQAPSIDSAKGVYLAGSFNYWHAGDSLYQMKKISDNRYTLTVPVFENQSYQYKYTLGHWNRVELAANDSNISNREFVSANGRQITDTVIKWKSILPATAIVSPQLQQINAMKDSAMAKLQPELNNMVDFLKQYVQNFLAAAPDAALHRRLDKQVAKKLGSAYRQVTKLLWDVFASITPEQKKQMTELLNKPEAQKDFINALGSAFGTVVEGKKQ